MFDFLDDADELNPDFRLLAHSPNLVAARRMARKLFEYRGDPDGNFLRELQTTGFDARVFELCLTGLVRSLECKLERGHNRPDFVLEHLGFGRFSIEAVTANPSGNHMQKVGSSAKPPLSENVRLARYERNLRIRTSIEKKLGKAYWNEPHVSGNPFVIAVQCFSHLDSLEYSASSLATLLYGFVGLRFLNTFMRIGSGWMEHWDPRLSAVLFWNQGTVGKLNRMGVQAGLGDDSIQLVCKETVFDPDPTAFKPLLRSYRVNPENEVDTWGRGTVLFHNPAAKHPLTDEMFPESEHWRATESTLRSKTPEFHPYKSVQKSVRHSPK